MTKHKLRRLPLAAAALVACTGAYAGYQSPDGNFTLSGFGTLGAVHTSTNDVKFDYPGQGGGVGTTWGFSPDSKIAAQGTYKFAPTLSATTQVMAKFDPAGQYTPNIDWAFLKWQAAPSLALRAGKMGAPFFMVSDFRNVGYANTTVRPNLDVYGQVPTDQFEGLDGTYQYNLGSTTINATLFYGDSKADYTSAFKKGATILGPSAFELKRMKGINLTAELDNGLTLRAGYLKAKMNITSDSVNGILAAAAGLSATTAATAGAAYPYFNALGAMATNSANAYVVTNGDPVSFLGFGATYDVENWIISGEYTKRRSNRFVADTTGWYTNVGYRVGKFTPFVGYSKLKVDSANVTVTPLVAPTVPGGAAAAVANATLAAYAAGINANIQSLLDVEKLQQHTVTIGSRWDVMPNVALKVQWDQVRKPADAWGLFFTPDPSTTQAQSFLNNPRKVNVLSVSMDVVF